MKSNVSYQIHAHEQDDSLLGAEVKQKTMTHDPADNYEQRKRQKNDLDTRA